MKPSAEGARPKPAVCRRLFADDDPADPDQGLRDNMFNQIAEQINRNLDDACVKYNFDFRNEVPLEGDWSWERIPTPGVELEPLTTAPPRDATAPPPKTEPSVPSADPLQPPTVPQ